jgi:hypothetical protein
MPEGNVFLGTVAVAEVIVVVLVVFLVEALTAGSSLAGFDRRWSNRRIVATAH